MFRKIQSSVSIEYEADASGVEAIRIRDGRGGVPFALGIFVEERAVRESDSDAAEVGRLGRRQLCTREAVLR